MRSEDVLNTDEQGKQLDWALIDSAVARLRASVMAVVFALTCGTGMFIATAWLLVRGGPDVGATLGLLRHYWPGFSVTWPGAFVGFFYAAVTGGVVGWVVAFTYNRLAARRRDA